MTTRSLPGLDKDDISGVFLLENTIRRVERLEASQSTLTELQVSLNLLSESFQEVKSNIKEVGNDLKEVKEDVSNIKLSCGFFEERIDTVEQSQKNTEEISRKELEKNLEKAKTTLVETEKTRIQKRNDLIKMIAGPLVAFIFGALATWLGLK
jgi:chromosome segregation ATPase